MSEIWRNIEGYEGLYKISNKGRVKSLYNGSERILRPSWMTGGYLYVVLCKNGNQSNQRIHRLVAKAFIPNPENLPEINHKDENKKNNCVENLEWMRHIDNCNYGSRNERLSRKLLQYSKDGKFIMEWPGAHEVERVLGIDQGNISKCCKGKLKSSGGFIWKYKEKD